MKKNFRFILGSINAILKEAVNYDFGIDMLSCNLDKKEYFKRVIEAVSYEENIKKIIEDNGYSEATFYYELTVFMNSSALNKEDIDVLDEYYEIVSYDAKFAYLMFTSEKLKSSKSFWINIVKQCEELDSLKEVLPFIPYVIKKDSHFQMLCASHALELGENAYNIPSMYGDKSLMIPTVAVEFISSVYYELEFKKEVVFSASKVDTSNFAYESRYGKHIRNNIDYLMALSDFRNKFVEISGSFITLIPKEYVTKDMISRVRENINQKDFFSEEDFLLLEYLDKISANIKDNVKVYEKK